MDNVAKLRLGDCARSALRGVMEECFVTRHAIMHPMQSYNPSISQSFFRLFASLRVTALFPYTI